jgi:phytoene synthase
MIATAAPSLAASYAFCERIARERARNFYYSFLLLDRDRRNAMCAIYAFMRYCDDLSDEGGATVDDRRKAITAWAADLEHALAGNPPDHLVWPAFLDTVKRYRIPHEYFREMIAGVSSDLEPRRMATFEELYRYCYQVASVVGLTIIHIFGFDDARALDLAEKCGIAFQLTNILRDVKEDESLDRVYLPAEDLERFHVRAPFEQNAAFLELMKFEGKRARDYYNESAPLIGMVSPETRRSLWALIRIYSRLLDKIEANQYRVLDGRIRVPTTEKLSILARAWLRQS